MAFYVVDIDTRLRVSRGIAETEASVEAFATLKERGHPDRPPAMAAKMTNHIWNVKN